MVNKNLIKNICLAFIIFTSVVIAVSAVGTRISDDYVQLGDAGDNDKLTNTATVVVGQSGAVDYLCDGVDDDVQMQDALDDIVAAGSGKLVVLEGDYSFGDTILVSNDTIIDFTTADISLASGVNKGFIRNTNWGPTIVDHDITIIGGNFSASGITAEANDGGISLRGVRNSKVRDITITDFWGFAGIYCAGANNEITGNNIVDTRRTTSSYGNGVYLTGIGNDYNIVDKNYINNSAGSAVFLEDNTASNTVENNHGFNNTQAGVRLIGSSNNTIVNNCIGGTGTDGKGIEIDGTNNTVRDNEVFNFYYGGINFVAGSDYNIIIGNTIRNLQNTNQVIMNGINYSIVKNNYLFDGATITYNTGIGNCVIDNYPLSPFNFGNNAAAPTPYGEGDSYYNTTDHTEYRYDGTTWQALW